MHDTYQGVPGTDSLLLASSNVKSRRSVSNSSIIFNWSRASFIERHGDVRHSDTIPPSSIGLELIIGPRIGK